MNKVGIYYAYWTHEWDADFIPFVEKVKRLGFDILEINAGTLIKMDSADRRRLKEESERLGIELTTCIGLPPEYDPANADAAVRRRGIEFLQRLARTLPEIGATKIGGILYSYWPAHLPQGETDRRPYLDRSVASLQEVMKVAEDTGVFFNMEVVNRFEQFLLNTASEALEYVDRVGSPNCLIMLDAFHMNIEEDSFQEAIRTAGAKLGHFHIGETNRRAPGVGKMDWKAIFGGLSDIGYEGDVVMEPFLKPGGQVGKDISIYRDLAIGVDIDVEAARAATFVRDQIRTAAGTAR